MSASGSVLDQIVVGVREDLARREAATPLPELRMWSQIVEAAIASNDDHLIKLVDSCREEERVYGGDDWKRAASSALA